ncbi:MAG: GIY-YIG nuclease family protein, partial [Candidatus Babeliales bacterium]
LFRNEIGKILYIGKAKSLFNRINSYFQKYETDWKVALLLDEYVDIEYIVTKNETEALLLEAQLIRDYKPKYNALLKEGQPFLYILFTQEDLPKIKLVRNKKEKGNYFGPFLQKMPTRKAYQFLVKTFRLNFCNKKITHGCLQYHLGNCAGSCKPNFDLQDYIFRLNLALDTLKNNNKNFVNKLEQQIDCYNKKLAFEQAKNLHNYLENVDVIFNTIQTHFRESKFATDIFVVTTPIPFVPMIENGLGEQLKNFLGASVPIQCIDCFDISHFQGKQIVGSCVRFTNGKPDKNKFRRFKVRTLTEQNDYAALREIVFRRYKDAQDLPDLILIDGGKGQLNTIQSILPKTICASLAKKEERLFSKKFPDGVQLDMTTDVGKLLITLRDYAHHFAIDYHRLLRKKNLYQT